MVTKSLCILCQIELFCKNNRSALLEPEFVSEAIKDLLDRGLIRKCDYPPYMVNPLTISVPASGKKRLILDLREVNKHVWKEKNMKI